MPTLNGNHVVVGFVGCVKEGFDTLEILVQSGFRPDFVLTLERAKAEKYSGYANWDVWREYDIPVHEVDSINSFSSCRLLDSLAPDILYVVGWSERLGRDVLSIPKIGVVGFHASLLPSYRGPAPVNWALINGEKVTGNTMFWMNEGIDTGPIIRQTPVAIDETDDCATLYRKMSQAAARMILDTFQDIVSRGRSCGTPQSTVSEPMPRRWPEDGLIRWQQHTAETLYNWVRALTRPYPGAFFFWEGHRIKAWKCSVVERQERSERVYLKEFTPEGVAVQLPTGAVHLTDLEVDGRSVDQPASVFGALGLLPGTDLEQGPRVLAVVAHPDDEVLGVGGTLIEHFKRGHDVHVVIVCGKGYIHAPGRDEDLHGMARRAAYYLGATTTLLGYTDQGLGAVRQTDLVADLEAVLKRVRPTYVYTHFEGDVNEDHGVVARAVNVACRPYCIRSKNFRLAWFETPSSTEWQYSPLRPGFKPNLFVDISGSLERKLKAVRSYKTELREYPHPRTVRSLRERAQYWGSVSGLTAAEPLMVVYAKE